MPKPKVAKYGSWKSPITSDLIVSENIRLGQIVLDGEDIYWSESRPTEAGRNVIVHRTPDGHIHDVNPPPYNARTRVHEYGGGAFAALDGTLYFSNFADQRLYRQSEGGQPVPLTPQAPLRYADGVVDRGRLRMHCVLEDHGANGQEAANSLVSIDLVTGEVAQVLAVGNDFYASPALSPDGKALAWLTWNHPNMPWDGTELWVAEFSPDGALQNPQRVAGGQEESIFQPQWSPDGVLYFASDRNEWWNLYHWDGTAVLPIVEMQAEFGRPQWIFGMSTYGFESPDRLVCTYTQDGKWFLATINSNTRQLQVIDTPYTSISDVRVMPGRAVFNAGAPGEPSQVVLLELDSARLTVLRSASQLEIAPGYLSTPESVEFPTANGRTAYGLYYSPRNQDFVGPQGEKPPLLVKSHGGPTSATSTSRNLGIQYWTSRGVAVLDVNYGGSTGYGRPYRQRLNGQWGIVDVQDCEHGARYLVARGDVDGERLMISGGSAGGWTTLCALTFGETFKAGASYYGVSDLAGLAQDTHKFESRYLDSMVGPYPQAKDLYEQRSPLKHTDRLNRPVVFFQGLEDKVVVPAQSEKMVEALRNKGIPVAYIAFEGEQHGFRIAENIKRALDAELYFYSRIFGFEPADPLEPIEIENL